GIGFGQHGRHILDVRLDAVVFTVRTAEATAASVGQVDGEAIRQRLGELHVTLRGFHRAVEHDHGGAVAELAVTDDGAVFGDDGAGAVTFRSGFGWGMVPRGDGLHSLTPPLREWIAASAIRI